MLAALQKACDVTLAVNFVIAPRKKARARALAQAVSLTKPGGFLLAVVPSLESVLYAEAVRKTFRPGLRSEFGFRAGDAYGDPGVLAIGGQPTKHYVAEEFALEIQAVKIHQANNPIVTQSLRELIETVQLFMSDDHWVTFAFRMEGFFSRRRN